MLSRSSYIKYLAIKFYLYVLSKKCECLVIMDTFLTENERGVKLSDVFSIYLSLVNC